jgi:hypothetical protein
MFDVILQSSGMTYLRSYYSECWGSSLYPLLFAVGILWSLIRHKKQIARVFLSYTVFLCLTIYNPVVVSFLTTKMGFGTEYYRFLWLLPVIPGVAYYVVRMIFSLKQKCLRILAAVVAVVVLILAGDPMDQVVQGFSAIQNIYKVPDDLRSVCSVIHEDSEAEQPRVVLDIDLNYVARQYDASLNLVLTRNEVLYRAGSRVISVKTDSENYQLQKTIMDRLYYNEDVDMTEFRNALIAKKVDYLVLPLASPQHGFLKECGCEAVAQTDERVVYSFDWTAFS